jgi:hypothetical protein
VLSQAQAQRRAIERVTGIPVEPLLVFSRAWVDRPLARRGGVRVLPARMLVKHLLARPAVLEPVDVERVRGLIEMHLRARAPSRPTARSVARWR